MRLEFNTDPSVTRVLITAGLLALETFIGGMIVVMQEGEMPDQAQILLITLIAAMQLVTFLSTFMRTGEMPTE